MGGLAAPPVGFWEKDMAFTQRRAKIRVELDACARAAEGLRERFQWALDALHAATNDPSQLASVRDALAEARASEDQIRVSADMFHGVLQVSHDIVADACRAAATRDPDAYRAAVRLLAKYDGETSGPVVPEVFLARLGTLLDRESLPHIDALDLLAEVACLLAPGDAPQLVREEVP